MWRVQTRAGPIEYTGSGRGAPRPVYGNHPGERPADHASLRVQVNVCAQWRACSARGPGATSHRGHTCFRLVHRNETRLALNRRELRRPSQAGQACPTAASVRPPVSPGPGAQPQRRRPCPPSSPPTVISTRSHLLMANLYITPMRPTDMTARPRCKLRSKTPGCPAAPAPRVVSLPSLGWTSRCDRGRRARTSRGSRAAAP